MKLGIHKRYQRAVRLAYLGVFLLALAVAVARYFVNRNELVERHSLGINDYAGVVNQTLGHPTRAIEGMGDFVRDSLTRPRTLDVEDLISQFDQDHLNEIYREQVGSSHRQRTGNQFGRIMGTGELLGRDPALYRKLLTAQELDGAFGLFQYNYPAVGVQYFCAGHDLIKLFPWREHYRPLVEEALSADHKSKLFANETSWGAPRVSSLLDELVVKLSHDVSLGGEAVGTLSMEIPLDSLTLKLKEQQALPGTAMVIDEASGYVLAHERLVKQNAKTLYQWQIGLPEAVSPLDIDQLKSLRDGAVIDGFHIQTHSVSAAPWLLVYMTDSRQLLAPARIGFAADLLLALIVLSAIVAALNRATRATFLLPATQLVDQIRHCAEQSSDEKSEDATLIKAYPPGWENWFRLVNDTFHDKRRLLVAKEQQNRRLDRLVQERTEQLQQSELRTQVTLEAVSDGLFDYRVDHPTFFTSDRFWTMIGYKPGEYSDNFNDWLKLLHPEQRKWVADAIKQLVIGQGELLEQLKQSGFFQMEYKLRCKQGDYRWIRARGSVVEWNERHLPSRIVGIHSDITDAKKADKVRQRQLQILNASPDLIGSFDQDGLFEYANQAVRKLCAMAPGEEGQHHIGELLDSRQVEQTLLPQALQQGYGSCEMGLRQGERLLPFSVTLVAHKQSTASKQRFSFIARDVSERKAFEESLLRAKQEAELASRYKSEFLANMSHEIRTPMNAVLGMLRLVSATEVNDEQNDYLRKAHVSAESLLEIINDILDFSKIEAGKLELEAIPFNLEDAVELAISHIAVRAEQKGLLLLARIDPQIPKQLLGDPVRLGQVLSNLLSNAVKFTERGRVSLDITLDRREDGRVHLLLTVQDTGIGIDEQQQGQLFNAFSQADGSTTRKYGGTGLGLSICRQLVKQMQGSIRVDSVPEQGSCFSVELALPESEQQDALDTALQGGNALLLLSSPERAGLLQEQLQHLGIQVVIAERAEDLASSLSRARFRYLLIDSPLLAEQYQPLVAAKENGQLEYLLAIRGFDLDTGAVSEQNADIVDGYLTKPVLISRLAKQLLALEDDSEQDKDEREEQQQLAGKQILVVEDNPINQEVAVRLLQQQGMQVSIANDGKEALEMVQAHRFDAVLMDIQMPRMDGHEATREIRSLPGFGDLPIVAMTAHAMPGDREKSLLAGMNDHLTKPIDPQELFGVLANFILSPGAPRTRPVDVDIPPAPVEQVPAVAAASPDETELLPSGLDETFGIQQFAGDRPALIAALTQFRKRYGDIDAEVLALDADGQQEPLRNRLHTLKGVAGNLGAHRLRALCQRWQLQPSTPALQAVLEELSAVLQAIDSLSATTAPPPTEVATQPPSTEPAPSDAFVPPPSSAEVGSLLLELESRLAANDYVEDTFMQPLHRHMASVQEISTPLRRPYRELTEALQQLDYDSALTALAELHTQLNALEKHRQAEEQNEEG